MILVEVLFVYCKCHIESLYALSMVVFSVLCVSIKIQCNKLDVLGRDTTWATGREQEGGRGRDMLYSTIFYHTNIIKNYNSHSVSI